jgi:hypothetical protein
MTEAQETTVRTAAREFFTALEEMLEADPEDNSMDTFAALGAWIVMARLFCAEHDFNYSHVAKVAHDRFTVVQSEQFNSQN